MTKKVKFGAHECVEVLHPMELDEAIAKIEELKNKNKKLRNELRSLHARHAKYIRSLDVFCSQRYGTDYEPGRLKKLWWKIHPGSSSKLEHESMIRIRDFNLHLAKCVVNYPKDKSHDGK